MKTQKGITLIALIITIIVMLILVGVSVTVAINTGLFTTASGVSKNTEVSRDEELERANGTVNLGGKDTGIQEYVDVLTGKKEKDELMKDNGYTHKMTITVKKDEDGDLDKNGTDVIGTYEYYIIEDETTGANLASRYNEFSTDNGKIIFLNEFELVSTLECYFDNKPESQPDPGLYELLAPGDIVLQSLKFVGDGEWKSFSRALTIATNADANILDGFDYMDNYWGGEMDSYTMEEYFDGKCPFIDFTFTKLVEDETPEQRKNEEMKAKGYTHKMAITVKKDAEGDLDANGTVIEGTYEYYIKEDITTGEILATEYPNDFSVNSNDKIIFLDNYELVSTRIQWASATNYGEVPDYYLSNNLLKGNSVLDSLDPDPDRDIILSGTGLSIGLPEDVSSYCGINAYDGTGNLSSPYDMDEETCEENFGGKCPFIDFTFTEL